MIELVNAAWPYVGPVLVVALWVWVFRSWWRDIRRSKGRREW